jgi:hypothetical protein
MARLVRANHGSQAPFENASMGGPDKPGHDGLFGVFLKGDNDLVAL